MMATDYIDYLEVGMTPEKNAQYFVANFVQEIFNKIIKAQRPDLAAEIKSKISMQLE